MQAYRHGNPVRGIMREGNTMENVSRRSFVGMAAGLAGAVAMGTTVAQAAPEEVAPLAEPVNESDPDMYRFHTSLDTINEIRRQVVEECEEYVCEDGTVIPKVYVQMRMLLDGLGAGIGAKNYTGPECFPFFEWITYGDQDLAQFYVNCPIGKEFTVLDAAIANDCDEAFAKEQCDRLAWTGAFFHARRSGIDYYNHQRHYHGITESSINLYKDGDKDSGFMTDFAPSLAGSELLPFPCYYPLPVNADVMAEGAQILPFDDIEGLLARHEVFAVSACQCRYIANMCGDTIDELPNPTDFTAVPDFVCADGHHLEKCFTFGEEAEFYIMQGIGRQLTREEARELMYRQINDEGCIPQSCGTKYTEVICMCDKGCTNMPGYIALGTDSPNYPNQSHYVLEVDKDLCIGCGMCAQRCMASAVEVIDGKAEITGYCFRCGQCGIVCPVGARKLANKPAELIPDLPENLFDWINKDTMYRYEKGLWPYPMAQGAGGDNASLVPETDN